MYQKVHTLEIPWGHSCDVTILRVAPTCNILVIQIRVYGILTYGKHMYTIVYWYTYLCYSTFMTRQVRPLGFAVNIAALKAQTYGNTKVAWQSVVHLASAGLA